MIPQQIRLEGQRRWPSNAQMQFAWNECIEYLSQQGEGKGMDYSDIITKALQELEPWTTGKGMWTPRELAQRCLEIHDRQSPSNPPEVTQEDIKWAKERIAEYEAAQPKPEKTAEIKSADEILDKHIEPWMLTDMDDSLMPYAIKAMEEYADQFRNQYSSLRDALENIAVLRDELKYCIYVLDGVGERNVLTKESGNMIIIASAKAKAALNNNTDKKEE